ncbi:hypothetical protein BX666DRAFT_1980183 [Dichotomocladium elegans]|nr:hypothetical protein BX666DRAFT_1980183 [Dichotomocladium elegans]
MTIITTTIPLVHQQQDLEQLATIVSDQRRKSPNRRVRSQRQKLKKRDPSRIPRPINCFMAYRLEMQKTITKQCPGANHRDISKLVAKWWRKEPNHVKDHFKQIAEKAKQEHSEMYPNYKYSPRRKRPRRQERQEHEQPPIDLQTKADECDEEMKDFEFAIQPCTDEEQYPLYYQHLMHEQQSVSSPTKFLMPPPIVVQEPIFLEDASDACHNHQDQRSFQWFPYPSTSVELDPTQHLVPPLSPFASGSSTSEINTGPYSYSPLSTNTSTFDMTQCWIAQHQQHQLTLTPSDTPCVLSYSSADSTFCSPGHLDFEILGSTDQTHLLYPTLFCQEDFSPSIYC